MNYYFIEVVIVFIIGWLLSYFIAKEEEKDKEKKHKKIKYKKYRL